MIELSRDDVLDLLFGATYLGTGGGGELEEGMGMIDEAVAAGKTFRLQSLDEAPDDALGCTPYLLGAISPLPPEEEAKYERLPRPQGRAIQWVWDRFEDYLGQKFYGTLACELGGANTAIAFYTAAMNDAVVLDADPAGRAVPEITHSTYFLNDLPAAPIVVSNEFGELMILEGVADDMRAEHLVRAISVASRNDVAAIDHALPISQLRPALIHGTMTKSLEIGRRCKAAIAEGGGNGVAAELAEACDGRIAFRGTVTDTSWRTEDGFTLAEFTLAGREAFGDHSYRVTIKNENMAAFRDGALDACIPELICSIDGDTGRPITNPHTYVGQKVDVVVLPAPAPFDTPRGHEIFGREYADVE